jgi:hypothetical protein
VWLRYVLSAFVALLVVDTPHHFVTGDRECKVCGVRLGLDWDGKDAHGVIIVQLERIIIAIYRATEWALQANINHIQYTPRPLPHLPLRDRRLLLFPNYAMLTYAGRGGSDEGHTFNGAAVRHVVHGLHVDVAKAMVPDGVQNSACRERNVMYKDW